MSRCMNETKTVWNWKSYTKWWLENKHHVAWDRESGTCCVSGNTNDIGQIMKKHTVVTLLCVICVTRTPTIGMAPIHFSPHPHLLPLPQQLLMHIHALPLLAGHTFSLSFLAIFPLIGSLSICTRSTHWASGLHPFAPFPPYSYHPNIFWTPYPYHIPSGWLSPLLPLPYSWSVTQFPFALTLSLVSDLSPFHLSFLVLLLAAWSVLISLAYINPKYHSCIL